MQIASNITPDPIDEHGGMKLSDLFDQMNNEYALLIDPYFEDPSIYLAYEPILANKEVVVVPTKPEYDDVVEACHDYFGINRKELLDLRFQHYCSYMTYKHILTIPGLENKYIIMLNVRIAEMQMAGSRYAGMIRYLETKPLSSLPWDFDLQITL